LIRVATAARPVQVRARPVRRVPLGRQAGIDPERRPRPEPAAFLHGAQLYTPGSAHRTPPRPARELARRWRSPDAQRSQLERHDQQGRDLAGTTSRAWAS